jgi:hypothetical protein
LAAWRFQELTDVGLAIVIVSYNARDELGACLESVFDDNGDNDAENDRESELEVIVVDNASTDGSAAMVRQRFARATVVESNENVGFARASNLGWRRAKSALVMFLNSDTSLPANALARLVEIMEARPDIGALGPLLRNTDESIQISFGRMMSLSAELRQKLVNAGYREGRGPLRGYVERRHAAQRDVDWVSGACLLTRRDLLERIGGFDEEFFLYSEDVDLCARLRAEGCRVVFTPDVEITHHRGRSASKDRHRAFIESHRSRLHFYRKHYGQPRLGLLKLYLTAKLGLAYVFRPSSRQASRSLLKLVFRSPSGTGSDVS